MDAGHVTVRPRWRPRAATAVAVFGLLTIASASHAQITLDGSLGVSGPLTGPNYVIPAGVGQIRGDNLFHSFGQFNVRSLPVQESATFTGPASIQNVVSRVTGGQASLIDGMIDARSSMPGASFFFINPAGVIVGPSASFNVGGAVHLSSANHIRFTDDEMFSATSPQNGMLTSAQPAAFGFLGPTGTVSIAGSVLGVDAGQTLSAVGGAVRITGATLSAPGGRLHIAGVTSGEVGIGDLTLGTSTMLGLVTMSGSSGDVTGDPGGTIVIRAGRLAIETTALSTGTTGDMGPISTLGVDIHAQDSAVLSGVSMQTTANGAGGGGDIVIHAGTAPADGTVEISGGSQIITQTAGSGRGGDVVLQAGRVIVDDAGIATVTAGGGGRGGDITLDGRIVALTNGGSIQTITQPAVAPDGTLLGARGGDVTLRGDSVSIIGQNAFAAFSNVFSVTSGAGDGGSLRVEGGSFTMGPGTTLTSNASFDQGTGGSAGAIVVDVGRLSMTFGANITTIITAAGPPGPGVSLRGADVTVTTAGEAIIGGGGGGIFSIADGANPGDITVDVGSLRLTDEAFIQGGSFATQSQGGNVVVRASDSIVISELAGISSQAFNLPVGQVTVSAPRLMIDRGLINTGTLGTGDAGPIVIDVGHLSLTRGGQIASSSSFIASGTGGPVTIMASESVSISGASSEPVLPEPFRGFVVDTSSGIFSTANSNEPLAGAGGDIRITAPRILLSDGGTISASSTSLTSPSARAGSVSIVFSDALVLDNASIKTSSQSADGGNISITSTGSRLHLIDSRITTSVESDIGEGGNITIGTSSHPTTFVLLDGSEIRADAFGGPGGNIGIFADVYLTTDTVVSASSALSTPGTIDVRAGVTDVSGTVKALPETAAEAATLLRASCTARLAEGKSSSLVVAGRGGVPPEPEGLLWSPVVSEPLAGVTPSRSEGQQSPISLSFLPASLDPKCAR